MTTPSDTSIRRVNTLSSAAHELYRALVDEILATGAAPQPEKSAALDELVENDWLVLDEHKRVDVLYPFSSSPTPVEVSLQGHNRYAMCAIDALGMAPMLDSDVGVTATCPQTGTPLEIGVSPDGAISSSQPDVVILRRRQEGAAHINRCGAIRFFQSLEDAESWGSEHGAAGDEIMSLTDAFDEATTMFGRCYSDGVRVWF